VKPTGTPGTTRQTCEPRLFCDIAGLVERRTVFVLATVVDSAGSAPQKPGAKLVVLPDGGIRGTVGGGALEHEIVTAARALLADPAATTRLLEPHLTHDLGMCCGGKMAVFLEKIVPGEKLIVFGAGHVGRALATFARTTGFDVAVADERPEWLNEERFPDVRRLPGPCVETARTEPTDDATHACVMTHDHGLDQEIVAALLQRPLRYLGVIGSRRKAEMFRLRLAAQGFAADEVARMRSPVGLAIGAQSPEEIAVSIVAELIALRHRVSEEGTAKTPGAPRTPRSE